MREIWPAAHAPASSPRGVLYYSDIARPSSFRSHYSRIHIPIHSSSFFFLFLFRSKARVRRTGLICYICSGPAKSVGRSVCAVQADLDGVEEEEKANRARSLEN